MPILNGARRQRSVVRGCAATTTLALLAACGTLDDSGEEAGGESGDGVVRLVMAPDPVWDWLTDQGIRQKMEEQAGIQILDSSSWDEFSVYAGGHADVVSAASYEVPQLEEATGVESTIFGKYNKDRSVFAVRSDSDYQDMCDLMGERVVTLSAVSTTIMWGIYAQEFCDAELTPESDDYDLSIADVQSVAPLLASGDAEACVCLPDFAIKELSSGEIRPLYDGRSAGQIFAEEFGNGHEGPNTNVFLAPTEWLEEHPEEAAFLLEVWERGIQEWQKHRDEIIETYPEHFAATTPEQIDFVQNWLDTKYDWFEDSVYLTEEWIEGERQIFDLMKSAGYIEEDIEEPTFEIVGPGQ